MRFLRYCWSFILAVVVLVLGGCSEQPKLSTNSPEALKYYEEGVAQWQKFYYKEAAVAFERALTVDSMFAMAWGRLAMLAWSTQNEPQAREKISRAIHCAQSASRREQLFVRMWDHSIHYRNKEAAAVADSLVDLFPKEPEAYLIRGNLYETSKNYDAAIKSYEHAADLDTAYAIAVMSLGYVYSSLGEHEKALEYMERYIRMAPEGADPRASYADLLLRLGRYDEALDQYKKALELKPDYWYAFLRLGEIYSIKGRLKNSEEEYRKAYEALPQSAQTKARQLTTTATLNMRRGNYAEAARQYEAALSVDTISGSPAFGLVRARIKMKDFKNIEQLVERIREVIEMRNLGESEAMQSFHLMKARLFTAQGKLQEALDECDQALEYSSPIGRGSVYLQVAEIKLKGESYEAAVDACEEALRVSPNSPEVLLALLKVYHAKGDKRMTAELGGRLLDFWKDADPDFRDLMEVKQLLGVLL